MPIVGGLDDNIGILNLVKLFQCKALARWIHQLTVVCFILTYMNLYDRYYPHAESLKHKFEEAAKGLQAELDSIQEVDD